MQLPIVAPAPLVTAHADVFRDLFENRCQFQHFQNYLTGLIVLDNKSLANITRCVLESADKTNLSRFFSEAPWFQDRVNDRRLVYLRQQTKVVRGPQADALLILDDTLCEHVGSLFDYVDRHYNHGDDTYPLAHNPVTSHYVSGPVRFPVDLCVYRRYEEVTRWEAFVHKHFPDRPIPTQKKERARLHKAVDPVLLADPDFQTLHQQFRTKIDLGIALLEAAIQHKVPFRVLLFDSWYLAEELVSMARYRKKDWISLLKKNRNLETNSFVLKDAAGTPLQLEGPHVSFQKDAVQLGGVPGCTQVEDLGSFRNEVGEGWHLKGAGDTVMDVVRETDAKFGCRRRQRHEGVPGLGTFAGARPEAHIPFTYPCARSQFGWVVVQGNFRVCQHHQQVALLGARLGNPLVQRLVARDGREERLELPVQARRLLQHRLLPIRQQLVVVGPKTLHEVLHQR